ncbi:MAG: hypothetical protein A4E60_03555 [Syntrophorhabdus sp. PtaB.Bin047]|nr:MAG: hypothetical protein A4E60_03555 [Syntrophorhabdus sp. PtaB.Bin047]
MDAMYPFLWIWMWPSMESVICPVIMLLKEPVTPTKRRTKMTPIATREAVRVVRRL